MKLVAPALFALLSTAASAELIQDNTTTLDSTTGLHWYVTPPFAYSEAQSQLAPDGWRHASAPEVQNLFTTYLPDLVQSPRVGGAGDFWDDFRALPQTDPLGEVQALLDDLQVPSQSLIAVFGRVAPGYSAHSAIDLGEDASGLQHAVMWGGVADWAAFPQLMVNAQSVTPVPLFLDPVARIPCLDLNCVNVVPEASTVMLMLAGLLLIAVRLMR